MSVLIKYVKTHKVIKSVTLGWSRFNLIVIILKSSLVLSDKSNLIEHTWVRLIELGKLASVELVQNPFKKKKLFKGTNLCIPQWVENISEGVSILYSCLMSFHGIFNFNTIIGMSMNGTKQSIFVLLAKL